MARSSGARRRAVLAAFVLLIAAAALWRVRSGRGPGPDVAEASSAPTWKRVVPPPAVLRAASGMDRKKKALSAAAAAGKASGAASLEELRIEAEGLYPDPEEAAQYFANGLLVLAARDPTELRRFFDDASHPDRDRILESFFAAWDVETFDTPPEQPAALLDSIRQLAGRSPGDSVALLEAIPPGDLREVLAFEIAEVWWDQDDAAARAWAESLPDPGSRAMALAAVAERWAKAEPGAAAAWALARADPDDRIASLASVLDYWVRKSPAESVPWVRENLAEGSREFDGLAALVAETWATVEPGEAFAWIWTLPTGPIREEAASAAILAGMEVDPEDTFSRLREWSASPSPPSSSLPGLAHLALSDWALRDPIAAASRLGTLPPSSFRDEAVLGFAAAHAEADPEAALEWVLSVSAGGRREEGIDLVVETWLEESRRAAAARDLEEFSRALELEGRNEEAKLVRERSQAILFPSDE